MFSDGGEVVMSSVNCKFAAGRIRGLGGVKSRSATPAMQALPRKSLRGRLVGVCRPNHAQYPIARHGYGVTSQPPFSGEIHQ